jgi:hypothetical protein
MIMSRWKPDPETSVVQLRAEGRIHRQMAATDFAVTRPRCSAGSPRLGYRVKKRNGTKDIFACSYEELAETCAHLGAPADECLRPQRNRHEARFPIVNELQRFQITQAFIEKSLLTEMDR